MYDSTVIMGSNRFATLTTLSLALLIAVSGSLVGQGREQVPVEEAGEPEEEFHHNHFGGMVGVSGRSDLDEVAPTIGLDYVRVLSPRWGVVVYTEMVSSNLERDIIVAVGATYYPTRLLSIALAVGGEAAEKEVTHNGTTETEAELAFLVRIGIAYGIPVTSTAAIAPTLLIDQAEDRTTYVLGIGMAVGF
jgi:hypothetical protein